MCRLKESVEPSEYENTKAWMAKLVEVSTKELNEARTRGHAE
jgi:hypothetical protein